MVAALVTVAAAAAAPGCKRSGGPQAADGGPTRFPLRPAAEGRPQLLATVVAGNADRSLGRVVELLNAVGMPMTAATIRASALAAMKIPAPALPMLRTDAPVAAVIVQTAPAPEEPAMVVAVSVDPAHAAGLSQALGKVTSRNLDAAEIQLPGEPPQRLWLLVRDGVALMAETQAALGAGGSLALAARAATGDVDVAVSCYPDAMAAAQGTDLPMLVYKFRENFKVSWKAAAEHGEKGTPLAHPGLTRVMEAMLDVIAARATDAASAGLDLRVDPKLGITLRGRVQPKADTPFARAAAVRAPYVLDPVVMGSEGGNTSPATIVATAGALPVARDLRKAITAAVSSASKPGDKPGDKLGGKPGGSSRAGWAPLLEELAAKLTGAWTTRADLGSAGLGYQYAYALAPGTEPGEVMDLLGRLAQDRAVGELVEALGGGLLAPKLRVTRKRGRLHILSAVQKRSLPPGNREALRLLAPGDRIEISLGAAPGRLLGAVGPGAAARLERMLEAAKTEPVPAAKPPGPFGEALAESQGQDALFYVDLGALATGMLPPATSGARGEARAAAAGAMPATSLPLFFVIRGGTSVAVDVRVPMATVTRAATLGQMAAASGLVPGLMR